MKKCCQRVNVTHLCSNRKWGRVRAVEMYGVFMMCSSLRKVLFNESLKNPLLFNCSFVSDSVTPWTAACQASLSFTISWNLLRLMSIESVIPSNHLILCRSLLLLPSIIPSIRFFSSESALCIRWPKDWSFSFSTSPSNEYSGLIYFRIDWFDLLAVQQTLKSLIKHHSLKASILQHSAFSTVPLTALNQIKK